jgi:RNA polymerase sigma-70 factor (ECF subfamily)
MTAVSPLGPSALEDEAFETLYEQYSRRVFGYCQKWLRSREEAEDAVQTTFLYAMRGLRRGVVPKLDEAWLIAIARNVCRTRAEVARRRAVEVARSPQLLEETVAAPARNDELDGLSEALGGLTDQQRRAILLREWQGLSYREIADRLALSQAAVETLLFRARRALAARGGAATP